MDCQTERTVSWTWAVFTYKTIGEDVRAFSPRGASMADGFVWRVCWVQQLLSLHLSPFFSLSHAHPPTHAHTQTFMKSYHLTELDTEPLHYSSVVRAAILICFKFLTPLPPGQSSGGFWADLLDTQYLRNKKSWMQTLTSFSDFEGQKNELRKETDIL